MLHQKLIEKLKSYSIQDILNLEKQDLQFKALEYLFLNKSFSERNFLFLTIANSLISYQLSGKGEDRWQEFAKFFASKKLNENFEEIISEFKNLLENCKNNKRFINAKINRLSKLKDFYKNFLKKSNYYQKNLIKLNIDLANAMKQKQDAKTIVFAIKMFGYGVRIVTNKELTFPFEISIPIDSRLQKIYQKYSGKQKFTNLEIKKFFYELSKKTNIPPLHLDSILRIKNKEFLEE